MCKNALTASLKSSVHVSCIAWIVTRLYRNLLGYPGPLKQVIFTSKYSDNFDQNEIITMMNNVDGKELYRNGGDDFPSVSSPNLG